MSLLDSERNVRWLVWLAALFIFGGMAFAVWAGFRLVQSSGIVGIEYKIVEQPGGQARLVVNSYSLQAMAWSPDEKQIAFTSLGVSPWRMVRFGARRVRRSDTAFPRMIYQTEVAEIGTGRRRGLSDPSMPAICLPHSWSQSGTLYAEASRTLDYANPDQTGIWAVASSTGRSRRLSEGTHDSYPKVSPDGRWVAFLRDARRGNDLMLVPAAGGAEVTLAGGLTTLRPFEWLDSRRILYVTVGRGRPRTRSVLNVVDVSTGRSRTLLDVPTVGSFCLLDGRVGIISATDAKPGGMGRGGEILLLDPRTLSVRSIRAVKGCNPYSLRRGPKDSFVFLSESRGSEGTGADLFQMSLDGRMVRLTGFGDVYRVSTSPLGNAAAFVRKDKSGRESLWIMRVRPMRVHGRHRFAP